MNNLLVKEEKGCKNKTNNELVLKSEFEKEFLNSCTQELVIYL